MNTWKRKALALLSVPLLAVPSAAGVYLWLVPHIGWLAAGLTAAGFESLYIGINILVINSPDLRRYARNVALAGVVTAVVFNTLSRYQTMVGGNLRAVPLDVLALALAVLESIPLAGLAYAVSVLLHRLSEEGAAHVAPAQQATTIAQLTSELAQLQQQLAQPSPDVAPLQAMLAQSQDDLAQSRSEAAQAQQQIAQLKAELAQPIAIDGIDLLTIARRLRAKEIPLRDTADILGWPESTLRSRLKATNGVLAE